MHTNENEWLKKILMYANFFFPVFKSEWCVCVDPLNFNSGSSGTSLLGSEVLNRLLKCFLLSVSFGAVCRRYCVYYPHWWKGLSSAQIFICGQLIDVYLVIGLKEMILSSPIIDWHVCLQNINIWDINIHELCIN